MPPKDRKIAASKRTKQTRLTFDPLAPSSSAQDGPSPAKVRYEKPKGGGIASMRPIQSSATVLLDDSDDDAILFSSSVATKGVSAGPKRTEISSSQSDLQTPKKTALQAWNSQRRRSSSLLENPDVETSRSSSNTPQPFTNSAKKAPGSRILTKRRSSATVDVDSSDGSAPEVATPSKKKTMKKNVSIAREANGLSNGSEDNQGDNTPITDEDEEVSILPISRSKRTKNVGRLSVGSSGRTDGEKASGYVDLSSNSDSDSVRPSQRTGKRGGKALFSRARKSKPSPLSEEDSGSDAVPLTQNTRRARQAEPRLMDEDSDLDSDDPIISPLKRSRPDIRSDESDIVSSPMKRRKPNAIRIGEEEEESHESEDELILPRPSKSDKHTATPSRNTRQSRVRRHRTDKEKTLELMKRRRAGENIEALTESSESASEDDEDEFDFQKLSDFEDEEDEEQVIVSRPKTTKPPRKVASGDEQDEYESDFIEDDCELGVPDHSLLDIPLEFTHAAHKPLKQHFKDAVEWMVHRKINPSFNREDPLYVQAFRKLDDEYGGLAKSKFVSSQWTAEFTRAIYARPILTFRDLAPGEEIEIAGQVICQVCNHRKYIPKYEIQLLGKPYHISTLDEVEQESDSDSSNSANSDDSNTSDYNVDGLKIAPESKTWLSGQYCKANAEQAHSLIHWKWALNDWVTDTLNGEGYFAPKKLAEREKMKAKHRRRCANDIVDLWEKHDQIKDLYRDFKQNLETAREASNQGPWQNKRGRR